jgi:hypothetical protein
MLEERIPVELSNNRLVLLFKKYEKYEIYKSTKQDHIVKEL